MSIISIILFAGVVIFAAHILSTFPPDEDEEEFYK